MINTKKEQTYSAAEIRRLIKEEYGIDRAEGTVNKWMINGLNRSGRVIKLDSIAIGGQRCSSLEAYERFIEELNQ